LTQITPQMRILIAVRGTRGLSARDRWPGQPLPGGTPLRSLFPEPCLCSAAAAATLRLLLNPKA
jgi:hypothetical protein